MNRRTVFTETLREVLLTEVARYLSYYHKAPPHQTMADLFGVTGPTIKSNLKSLAELGWIEFTGPNEYIVTEEGREVADFNRTEIQTIHRQMQDQIKNGPIIMGFVDMNGLIRTWRGGAAKKLKMPKAEWELRYLHDVDEEFFIMYQQARQEVTSSRVLTREGRYIMVWCRRLSPKDADKGIVFLIHTCPQF